MFIKKNESGRTALHFAAIKGHIEIIDSLISNGAKIDAGSKDNYTPLHYTAMWGNKETLEYLISKGANVNNRAAMNYTPIIHAAAFNNIEHIKVLLKHGADINVFTSYGGSPLHRACTLNHLELISFLLDNGADINLQYQKDSTPLMESVMFNGNDGVELLLKKGANVDIQEKNWGFTAFHYSVVAGNLNITKKLLKAGVTVNKSDNNGKTPFYYANKYNHQKIKALLAKYGANTKNIPTTKSISECLGKSLENGEAYIWFTRFGGWIVKTRNHLLVLNYNEKYGLPDEASLANGYIVPDEIMEQDVTFFISHENDFHFTEKVLNWSDSLKNVQYIFGFKPETSKIYKDGYNGPTFEYIETHQSKMIDNIKIIPVKTNSNGQGFIIKTDDLVLYISAYLANQGDDTFTNFFKNEIDFVVEQCPKLDIAFLQTTYGFRNREPVKEGFMYAVNKLKPHVTFPMGEYNFSEYNFKNLAEEARKRNIKLPFGIAEHNGDRFFYKNGHLVFEK